MLMMDGGRIVEDGPPADLARKSDSRYRTVLDADERVHAEMWSSPVWRRLRLGSGRLSEGRDDAKTERAA